MYLVQLTTDIIMLLIISWTLQNKTYYTAVVKIKASGINVPTCVFTCATIIVALLLL